MIERPQPDYLGAEQDWPTVKALFPELTLLVEDEQDPFMDIAAVTYDFHGPRHELIRREKVLVRRADAGRQEMFVRGLLYATELLGALDRLK